MYNKILVPLDGSDLAEVALPYAKELAERLDSEVMVVCVEKFDFGDALGHMPETYPGKAEETKYGAERYLEKLAAKFSMTNSTILIGHPAEEIVSYADKENFSLLVMATHGRSGIKLWALGSVADKTVRLPEDQCCSSDLQAPIRMYMRRALLEKFLFPWMGQKKVSQQSRMSRNSAPN